MKFKLLKIVFIISFLISCHKTDKNINFVSVNDFIDDFIETNSAIIYNNEIERVRVNYFVHSNMLFYTFKKMEVFNANGIPFLQVYPKDSSDIPNNRKESGNINLSISEQEILNLDDSKNFLIKKLQFPFDVKAISTG